MEAILVVHGELREHSNLPGSTEYLITYENGADLLEQIRGIKKELHKTKVLRHFKVQQLFRV